MSETLLTFWSKKCPGIGKEDYKKLFIIQCDASKLSVGVILAQANENDEEMPIGIFLRS